MKLLQTNYSKKNFLEFLKNNNFNDIIINKFIKLPENIYHNGNKFKLYIEYIDFNPINIENKFEINYYSEELIEFLFNSKVFNDVELSINNLICNLRNSNFTIENDDTI